MHKVIVTVQGPAGSGKSAVAQVIAMLLDKVELKATTDLSVDLRNTDELQVVIDGLIARDTHIDIREVHTSGGEGVRTLLNFKPGVPKRLRVQPEIVDTAWEDRKAQLISGKLAHNGEDVKRLAHELIDEYLSMADDGEVPSDWPLDLQRDISLYRNR